mmetsp:Transcript_51114/g.119703  ORF Transcript_51114/g.119703 Transcript_51114/m.119703 type:complete len:848 (+) Transcript_51114:51-2594(+)
MAGRPLKMPGHRPIPRPGSNERASSLQRHKGDLRSGMASRALSRGRRPWNMQKVVADGVAAREATLQTLRKVDEGHAQGVIPLPEVRREVIDILLRLRLQTLEVVEAIEAWRAGSFGKGEVWPEPGSGEQGNYMLRLKGDTQWLADSPLGELLHFSPKSDPFFVVPSVAEQHVTSTNQMTPLLQARRRADGDKRRGVLPLSSTLLKRIRKAELSILRESLRLRMQGKDSAPGQSIRPQVVSVPAGLPDHEQHLEPPLAEPADSEMQSAPSAKADHDDHFPAAVPVLAVVSPQVQALDASLDFQFMPWKAEGIESIRRQYQEYIARVHKRLVLTMEPWESLQKLFHEEGGSLEWFWLRRRRKDGEEGDPAPPEDSQETASSADGLAIYRLRKMSKTFGQLIHVSVAGELLDLSVLSDAVAAVRTRMFAWLPIQCIRTTLWYVDKGDGGMEVDTEIAQCFKDLYFKWFQLLNADKRRGQVLNRPRADEVDPPMQPDAPSVELCLGQAWLHASTSSVPLSQSSRSSSCSQNLVVAACCMKSLWARQTGPSAGGTATNAQTATVRESMQEGLVRGLQSGKLMELLARCAPVGTRAGDGDGDMLADNPASLALDLGRSLEATASGVPGVHCESSDDAAALLRRLGSAVGYAEASLGLGVEALPDAVASMAPKDAAFGRLFVTLDWHKVVVVDSESFEVPVHFMGNSPKHAAPIFYMATSEDDMFVVVIPWSNLPLPREEAVFGTCTEILRSTTPMTGKLPFTAIRLSGFALRSPMQTAEIADKEALGFRDGMPMHVAEFASLLVSAGREMPGRLSDGPQMGETYHLTRPFIFALWHTAIDDLNVPLAAMFVT